MVISGHRRGILGALACIIQSSFSNSSSSTTSLLCLSPSCFVNMVVVLVFNDVAALFPSSDTAVILHQQCQISKELSWYAMRSRRNRCYLVITRADRNDFRMIFVLVASPHKTLSTTNWMFILEIGLLKLLDAVLDTFLVQLIRGLLVPRLIGVH